MKKIWRLIGILLINILLIIIALEVGLRVLAPRLPGQMGVAARWITTGSIYPDDWKPPWRQSHEHYYVLRPGIENQVQYGSATVKFHLTTTKLWETSDIGVRNAPVDYFVDAMVVGDSFGFCFTERVDCWVTLLQNQTGRGLVNLSQPVTGTTSHYRMLETFAKPMTPPLVIWQAFGNDFNDDYGLAVFRHEQDELSEDASKTDDDSGSISGWLRRYSVAFAVIETALTGNYRALPADDRVHSKPYTVTYGKNDEHRLQFGSKYEQDALDMAAEKNQIGLDYSREALQDAQSLIAAWDGEMALVIIPTREEVYRDLTAPVIGEEAVQKLQSARDAWHDLCDEMSLNCFDPYELFRERAIVGEALYHVDDMHLNAHGNAVLAGAFREWLQAQDLLTCNPAVIPDCSEK